MYKFTNKDRKKAKASIDEKSKNEEWVSRKKENFQKTMAEKYSVGFENPFKGKVHSEETLNKLRGHDRQKGEKNSQFGTMWIHSLELKESKRIKKEEFPTWEQDGWLKGRKMKY